MGSALARLMVQHEASSEVCCFDRSLERARRFLNFEEGRDIPVEELDASSVEETAKRLKGFDMAVNALPTFMRVRGKEVPLNPRVMEASLKAGVSYMDMACYGGRRRRAEQLALSKKFEREGLLALVNSGASPGLTNILARESYEDLDEAHSLVIMSVEDQRGSSFIISWSREEMLGIAMPVLTYRSGKYMFVEPFSEVRIGEFPEPVGVVKCYSVSNDESYTIPHFLRLASYGYYAGGSDIETVRALYRLGVLEDKKIAVSGRRVHLRSVLHQVLREPLDPHDILRTMERGELEDAYFAVQTIVEGEVGGERALSKRSVVFPSQREITGLLPGSTYISFPTALCALAVLRAIRGRRLSGVLPPEVLPRFLRRAVLGELEKHRVFVNEEFRVLP